MLTQNKACRLKNVVWILIILVVGSCKLFHSTKRIVSKKVPEFNGITMDGKIIEPNCFKGKVTVLSLFYLGCLPCMTERKAFNEIRKQYSTDSVQILALGVNTADQIRSYFSKDSNKYSMARREYSEEIPLFDVMACCSTENALKIDRPYDPEKDIVYKVECDYIPKLFGVNSYPSTFIVNRQGKICYFHQGFSVTFKGFTYGKEELKALTDEIDRILARK